MLYPDTYGVTLGAYQAMVGTITSGVINKNPSYATGGPLPTPAEAFNPRTTCWHCDRDPHDGPLTQRVANMWSSHSFDANYDPDEDLSPILCVGSDFYGPAKPRAPLATGATSGLATGGVLSGLSSWTLPSYSFPSTAWSKLTMFDWPTLDWKANTWLPLLPEEPDCTEVPANLPVKYEPQNLFEVQPWVSEYLPESTYSLQVSLSTADFSAEIPVPKAPKVDYAALDATLNPKPYKPTKGKKKK